MIRRLLAGGFTLLLLLAALGVGGVFYGLRMFEQPGPALSETVVELPRGSSLGAIARRLEESGVVADARVFRYGVRYLGDPTGLKAGEYAFPAGASMAEVAAMLGAGDVVQRKVTVAEGLTSREIVALLLAEPALSGAVETLPDEGWLAPETYFFERGEAREAVLARMAEAQRETLAELWPARAPDLPLATPEEALVLASIVEKETGVASERPEVASVFINRLRRGMRLQSDPTVIYGVTGGREAFEGPIKRSDLDADNAWNTYRIAGLPPTPIANPGRASIAAVLDPAETDYLYFVADGTGGHAFSKTLAEHNENVRRWREIERGG